MYSRADLEALASQKMARYGATRMVAESVLDLKLAARSPKATVFCSHSHKDGQLILGMKVLLDGLGVQLYVDWDDPEMPERTSAETAAVIKGKIKAHQKFVVVVTDNSKGSRWVPWELGIADQAKQFREIALWPVTEAAGDFTRNEYLGLYQTIEKSDQGNPCVYQPGATGGGVRLETWLET
jgi:hypothetical protein